MYTFGDLVDLLSAGYVLAFVVVVALVLWFVRPVRRKRLGVGIACVVFGVPLITKQVEINQRVERNRTIGERFQKLCAEKAGDRIVRIIEGVDGIYLVRPRKPTKHHKEYLDQFWMGDPYGHSDYEAERPDEAFLADRGAESPGSRVKLTPIVGFEFIELPNPDRDTKDSGPQYLRITAIRRTNDTKGRRTIEYERVLTDTLRSRYGVEWEDISTPEDRKVWIAGGRMRVIDLHTKEVIAERTGYVIDPEQGQRFGGGISWLVAQSTACPPFEGHYEKTKEFVAKALKSSREMSHGR